jgi:2-polyprenyl-3-methyl-5-hydroxy-6-metoxy-1,4-benzoquinol methylase
MSDKLTTKNVIEHFDSYSATYDQWKHKNWYYYKNVKALARAHVPEDMNVLEIGTGTGEVLAALKPKAGVGTDISGKMIEKAAAKFATSPNLKFLALDIADLNENIKFDYFVLTDVIEHVADAPKLVRDMKLKAAPHTKIFMSMVNPVWEPVLMLAEKLGLKMPEGEHTRITSAQVVELFRASGYGLESHGFHLPLPKYVPVVSNIINGLVPKIPLLNRCGLIEYFVFAQTKGK